MVDNNGKKAVVAPHFSVVNNEPIRDLLLKLVHRVIFERATERLLFTKIVPDTGPSVLEFRLSTRSFQTQLCTP